MLRIAVAFILLWLAPLAALAETTSKTVRDWTAACDGYSCRASVTGEGGLASGGTGYQLEVARASGGNEVWFVTLIAHNVTPPGPSVTVEVPGLLTQDTAVSALDDDRFGLADQVALEAIFPALRKGSRATIRYEVNDAEVEESFSLSGLAAVLLWMDEAQGQAGRSGMVKAYDVRTDEPIPETDLAQLKDELLAATPLSQCQWNAEDAQPGDFAPVKYDLGGGYGLYAVICTMGAYQPSTVVFLEGPDGLQPQPFPDFGGETGWGATLYLGEVDYDPATKVLHHFAKFRGIGDCGTWSDFQWTGYVFKLLQYAYKACADEPPDGNASLGDFPVIYKAE